MQRAVPRSSVPVLAVGSHPTDPGMCWHDAGTLMACISHSWWASVLTMLMSMFGAVVTCTRAIMAVNDILGVWGTLKYLLKKWQPAPQCKPPDVSSEQCVGEGVSEPFLLPPDQQRQYFITHNCTKTKCYHTHRWCKKLATYVLFTFPDDFSLCQTCAKAE